MTEHYSSPLPPAVAKWISKMGTSAMRLYYEIERQDHNEQEWLSSQHEVDADTPPTTERLIFSEISTIAGAMSLGASRRLYEGFGLSFDGLLSESMIDAHFHSKLDAKLFGVSPATLFHRKTELAQKKPAEVFGHMLLSTAHPHDEEVYDDLPYNYLPITAYSADEIDSVIKRAQFPIHIISTLKELSSTYQQALRGVKKSFFEPTSPHFPAITALYQEISNYGTPFQADLFHSQVLGVGTPEQGRQAYKNIMERIEQGNHTPLYEECLATIEESFDGLLGEEVYNYLGIEHTKPAAPNGENYGEVQRKRRQLLKLAKDSQGAISLDDGHYGQLDLIRPEIHYHKNGPRSNVTLHADIQTTGTPIPIDFRLGENDSYSWNLLRTDKEIPHFFDLLVQADHQALDEAMSQLKQSPTSVYSQTAFRKPEYMRDPIYDLRKEERRRTRDQALASIQHSQEEQPSAKPSRAPHQAGIRLPEAIAGSLGEDILAKTIDIIEKYSRGLYNIALVRRLSVNGKKVFRLKNGDVRVLIELTGSGLTVVDVGLRKSVYNK